MGRPPNTETRRAEIASSLLRVMAREGYARATVAAIAREAGLAAGLVHYHFTNKEEILVEALGALVARVESRVAQRLASAGDSPRERIAAFVDGHVALGPGADPEAVAAWVVIGAEAIRQPEVRALHAQALRASHQRLRVLVRDCLHAEGRHARNAASIAAAIIAAIEGAFALGVASPDLMPRGGAAPMLRRMVSGLIEGEALT